MGEEEEGLITEITRKNGIIITERIEGKLVSGRTCK